MPDGAAAGTSCSAWLRAFRPRSNRAPPSILAAFSLASASRRWTLPPTLPKTSRPKTRATRLAAQPRNPPARPACVGGSETPGTSPPRTLRTTAGDLAAFLIELAEPRQLSEELAVQLRTPKISASDEISWGLGPGIQHSPQGDALWQWGQTLDLQCIIVIYPKQRFGVVVSRRGGSME